MLNKLREERGKAIAAARGILDQAEGAGRELTDEELGKHDELIARQDDLRKQIASIEKQDDLEREALASISPEIESQANAEEGDPIVALQHYLMNGFVPNSRDGEMLAALQSDVDQAGGFLVPEQTLNQLIKAVDDVTFVRSLATVIPVQGADSLGVPTLDADPADADWTSELLTGNEDSTMAFGSRSLSPHPLAKRIKVSQTLLRRSSQPIEALVAARLGYKFGITLEKAFLTGSGSQQPLGVFTASSQGISTGRDVAAASATALAGDDLIKTKYALKSQYQATAQWLLHRDVLSLVARIKDTANNYIWRAGLSGNDPDTLLNRPINMSEYAPNTVTTGQYVAMFGDFKQYWIAEDSQFQLQRLSELYAETNQVGFIGRQHADGMPVLEEAFARLKMA